MRTLRVANIAHPTSLPYRVLADLDFIRYEENSPAENGRRLHEGEVDVAHISLAEFAMHGGYVGLDFGVGCKGFSDMLMLYSQVPLEEVETVNIFSAASSTPILLRILLSKHWGISPLLVRRAKEDLLDLVVGKEAAVIFHETPDPLVDRFPVAIDLVAEWAEITGKPYVASVWAVRPGVLKHEHLRAFNEAFHRTAKARASLTTLHAQNVTPNHERLAYHVANELEYYFDVPMIEGLELFLEQASALHLLPQTRYRSATLTLIGRHVPRVNTERTIPQILESVLEGARVGMRDGIRLAYEASLGDLALVADTLRNRSGAHQVLRQVAEISLTTEEVESEDLSAAITAIRRAIELGVHHVRLVCSAPAVTEPRKWCSILRKLKKRNPVLLEAFGPTELHWISTVSGVPLENLLADLINAGLDIVGTDGGEMLVDRVMAESTPGVLSVQEWLSVVRWVHRCGGASRGAMRVSRHDSWEDRLVHLNKLRTLQDEMPGVRSFSITAERGGVERVTAELKVRCTALARIFLDNVAAIEEGDFAVSEGMGAVLSLGAGARDVRMTLSDKNSSLTGRIGILQNAGFQISSDVSISHARR